MKKETHFCGGTTIAVPASPLAPLLPDLPRDPSGPNGSEGQGMKRRPFGPLLPDLPLPSLRAQGPKAAGNATHARQHATFVTPGQQGCGRHRHESDAISEMAGRGTDQSATEQAKAGSGHCYRR
jgi:hypothetical protein